MGSSTNTTSSLSTSSLPENVSAGLGTAVQKVMDTSNAPNPLQGWVQPTAPWGNPAQMAATAASTNVAGYQPQQVSANYQPYMVKTDYTPQTVAAGDVTRFGSPTVGAADIAAMQNPYTQQVVNTSLDELNRQLARTNQMSSGRAASAGAFGGDRAAIELAENARNANQIAAQTIAGLNHQGFQTAAGLANQNASRQLQAGTSQSGLELNAGEANQYAGLQGASLNAQQDRSNQTAYGQTQSLNAQQDRSNQTAGLQGAQVNLQGAGQLNTIGNQYQQTQQSGLDRGWAGATQNAMWPFTQTNQMVTNMGTLAGQAPRTVASNQTTPGPSTVGQLAGLGTTGLALNQLLPGGIAGSVKGLFGASDGSVAGANIGDQASSAFNTSGFLDPSSGFDAGFGADLAARGGLIGYAPGGLVSGGGYHLPIEMPQAEDDGTYVAVDPSYTANRNAPVVQPPPPPVPPQVNPRGDYPPGYTPQAGLGPQMNVNAGGPDPTSAAVTSALDVDPVDFVQNGGQSTDDLTQSVLQKTLPPSAPDEPQQPQQPQQPSAPAPGLGAAANGGNDRITQSANPSAPMPPGYSGGPAPTQQEAHGGQNDWSHNQVGMALLSAGLGMMASKSPHALSAIGEGGLAGVQQINQMRKQDTDAALKEKLYGVRQQQANTGQQRANDYGRAIDNRATAAGNKDKIDRARLAEQTRKNDLMFTARMQRDSRLTGAELQQKLINAYIDENPGSTTTEAYAALKNYTAKNSQAEQRLGIQQQLANQGAQRINNMQEWRAFQQESKATDQEIAQVRTMVNSQALIGKTLPPSDALRIVRRDRESAGPAPIVGKPITTAPAGAQPASRPATSNEVANAKAALARNVPRESVIQHFTKNGVTPPPDL